MSVALTVISTTKKSSKPQVLGTFGKGIEGSFSLNYGTSSGRNCDPACPHHAKSTAANPTHACYATRSEAYRPSLKARLARHERTEAATLTLQALIDLRKLHAKSPVKWLRFSVAGSLPQIEDITPDFRKALRLILDFCVKNNIPVHMPVETAAKAKVYRQIVAGRCVVRESVHDDRSFIVEGGPLSAVAGTKEDSQMVRLIAAKTLAARHTAQTGQRTIVCPAVATRIIAYTKCRENGGTHQEAQKEHGSPLAKCGNCTACSKSNVSIIYPLH
jgi:hypothetical protein